MQESNTTRTSPAAQPSTGQVLPPTTTHTQQRVRRCTRVPPLVRVLRDQVLLRVRSAPASSQQRQPTPAACMRAGAHCRRPRQRRPGAVSRARAVCTHTCTLPPGAVGAAPAARAVAACRSAPTPDGPTRVPCACPCGWTWGRLAWLAPATWRPCAAPVTWPLLLPGRARGWWAAPPSWASWLPWRAWKRRPRRVWSAESAGSTRQWPATRSKCSGEQGPPHAAVGAALTRQLHLHADKVAPAGCTAAGLPRC